MISVRARAQFALGVAVGLVAAGTARGFAQPDPSAVRLRPETYRQVKLFDFEERDDGNYESTPMYWQRFSGPGLPFYSSGEIDFETGHKAPPAFRFQLSGGSVAYEYEHVDLSVSPESDYLIEGYIRATGLEHAQAMIASYLLDPLGNTIPGSHRVSPAVRNEVAGDTGWQRVAIQLRGQFPLAHTLRLQLWVLQDYVWQEPGEGALDPIIRQDVDATVWFDDIAIYRMPQVRLRLSNPGGLVAPDAAEHLLLDVHNATLATLVATLRISDDSGHEPFREGYEIAATDTRSIRTPVPDLAPGLYTAHVGLGMDNQTLLERSLQFAILPRIRERQWRYEDLGLDFGRWSRGDIDGVVNLVDEIGCGATKIGLEMAGSRSEEETREYLDEIRSLARQLVISAVDTTAVILPPRLSYESDIPTSTYVMFKNDPSWDTRVGPAFAYLGDLLFSWQLGSEPAELRQTGRWTINDTEDVRYRLERFVAVPALVVPRSVHDTMPTQLLSELVTGITDQPKTLADYGVFPRPVLERDFTGRPLSDPPLPFAYSFWLPKELPAQAFPWHLAFWFETLTDRAYESSATVPRGRNMRGPEHWLALELNRDRSVPAAERVADTARRVVLGKSVNPDRLYVPAPFELSETGGVRAWQPTDEYIPLRTLFRYLSGRLATAALRFEHDAVGVLFTRGDKTALVLWTWQIREADPVVDLYVGDQAVCVQLTGEIEPLNADGALARIPISFTPRIIEDVDAPLLMLQDSFRVEPSFLQLHEPRPRPVLTLRNYWYTPLNATLTLHPPPNWTVAPNPIQIELGPGEELAETLHFNIPPRQVATRLPLRADLHISRPRSVDLQFELPLRVELRDIVVKAVAWWDGSDLMVEQSLRNMSGASVSFTAFCQAPGRAQKEGAFLDVPPGEIRVQGYRFPRARDVAGGQVWAGIQEIDGRRSLDQLVVIPP